MSVLIAGLVIFLGLHSVSIVAEPWRNRMAARLGDGPWKGFYTLVAIAGFVLIVAGYGMARQDPVWLYSPPLWLRHVAMLLLIPVFPLLVAAYVPGRTRAVTRHPLLVATKLWALAHLLANGTLADVVLFGSFLAWAVADRISLKRRAPRPVPELPQSRWSDMIAVVVGLALYFAFVFWLHGLLIGVPLTLPR